MRPTSRAMMRRSAQQASTAAARDGVAIDRRDHRFRMKEHCVIKPVQRRQELPNIVGAALAQPFQIDAGRKDLALPGQHHRLRVGLTQIGKAAASASTEFDIERIGLAVRQRQDRQFRLDVSLLIMHVAPRDGLQQVQSMARCDSRSACTIAAVNTTIASSLMRERQAGAAPDRAKSRYRAPPAPSPRRRARQRRRRRAAPAGRQSRADRQGSRSHKLPCDGRIER